MGNQNGKRVKSGNLLLVCEDVMPGNFSNENRTRVHARKVPRVVSFAKSPRRIVRIYFWTMENLVLVPVGLGSLERAAGTALSFTWGHDSMH